MKSHITPKQAKQVSEEVFYSLFDSVVKREDWFKYHHKKVDIALLLNFLSENIDELQINKVSDIWVVIYKNKTYNANQLVDVLWEIFVNNWGK